MSEPLKHRFARTYALFGHGLLYIFAFGSPFFFAIMSEETGQDIDRLTSFILMSIMCVLFPVMIYWLVRFQGLTVPILKPVLVSFGLLCLGTIIQFGVTGLLS